VAGLWRNLAVALTSFLGALLLAEFALRAIGFSYPNFWHPDPLTGSTLRPGMEGWQQDEGRAYVRINSRGLRDREHAIPKPAGTYRIAILGDSYAEALQVDLERTFWARLAAPLQRCGFAGGRKVEAVNLGVSGFGTGQEVLLLRERAWQYEPDMVVLAFFPGNDVRNNSRRIENQKGRPYFVLHDGRLELDDSYRNDPGFVANQRTAVARERLQGLRAYQLLRRVKAGDIARRMHNAPIAAAIAAEGRPKSLTEPGLDENVFREPVDAAWREAWAITDRLVAMAHEQTQRRGARFLLVVLSTPGTVYPDARMRAQYAEGLGVRSLFYPEERLQALGARYGFEVLALAPAMQRRADAEHAYFHGFANTKRGFGHWNEAGHAAAAELIAARLCAAPAGPAPSPSSTRH
jgi:hypothetical protein